MSTTFAAAREKVSSTRSCVTSPSAVANDGTLERVSPGHPGNPGNDIALRALMVAYQRGDLEAFEQFYVALEPELRGFLRTRCHDPQRVDDLLQETFLQLHRSRRGYLPGLPVRPWVYAIAKRVFLMHVRKVRRRESREMTELSMVPEPEVPAGAARLAARAAILSAPRPEAPRRPRAVLLPPLRRV